jgi:hypothetical protein
MRDGYQPDANHVVSTAMTENVAGSEKDVFQYLMSYPCSVPIIEIKLFLIESSLNILHEFVRRGFDQYKS